MSVEDMRPILFNKTSEWFNVCNKDPINIFFLVKILAMMHAMIMMTNGTCVGLSDKCKKCFPKEDSHIPASHDESSLIMIKR